MNNDKTGNGRINGRFFIKYAERNYFQKAYSY